IVVIYSIWLTLKIITWITIFPLNEFILRTDITYNIVKNILINNDIDPETFSLPYTLISGIKFSLLFSLFLFTIILVLLRNNYYYYQANYYRLGLWTRNITIYSILYLMIIAIISLIIILIISI
ncbi:unnamed protein product, partial [marine sediment metagenome]